MTKISGRMLLLRGGAFTYALALFAQLVSAASGLLLVNVLPKSEFAIFAVFTALLQVFVAHSDLGTSGATGYFYREHRDWHSFKTVALPAIARMRFQFFVFGGIVFTVLFISGDVTRELTSNQAVTLLVLALGTACFGMVNSLQSVVLAVRGDASTSVRIDSVASLIRLALIGGMFVAGLISAEAALATSLFSTIFSFVMGRIYVPEIPLGLPRNYNREEQRKLFRYLFPLIPGFLFYAIQPSILIWLSAIFGSTQQIAEVGAVNRIGQIVSFLGIGLNLFALPHLASLRDDNAFKRSYFLIWLTLLVISVAVFFGVALLRHDVLLLLGQKYLNLENEVILVTGTSLLSVLGGYANMVNRVRGWNKLDPAIVAAQFLGQLLLIALLPLNSTTRILAVGLAYAAIGVLVLLVINIIGFVRPSWVAVRGEISGGDPAKHSAPDRLVKSGPSGN